MAFSRFEDISAWQKSREMTRAVYRVSGHSGFRTDFELRGQMRRAAVSTMSNIAEGFGRGGNKEFCHFLGVARGSVAEVQSQLYVALDAGLIGEADFREIYGLAEETGRLIGGLLRYLSRSNLQGSRHVQTASAGPAASTAKRQAQSSEPRTQNSEL